MIFGLLNNHNHDNRVTSITRILHITTWDYFTSRLPYRLILSQKVVREAIMTELNDLVQELWRTSSDEADRTSLFAMHRLLGILGRCFNHSEVCFDFSTTAFDLADKYVQMTGPDPRDDDSLTSQYYDQWDYDEIDRAETLFDGYRKMFDLLFSKHEDLSDMLRLLPGVVVQRHMSIQEMAELYRVQPDLLERLIKSPFELLRPLHKDSPRYILDDYASGFLKDRDRSQLYYCDPMIQNISICRHFLSLLDGSNAFDLEWYVSA